MLFKALLSATLFVLTTARSPWEATPGTAPFLPGGAKWWMGRHQGLLNITRTNGSAIKAIFLGDSITDGWSNNGAAVWTAHYANRGVFNYGIGGDTTENVLWRIEHGEFDGLKAKVVVLMIGTNNLSINDKPVDIAKGIRAILDQLHAKLPSTSVLLLSVLPRDTVQLDTAVHELNQHLATFADGKAFHYFNLGAHFETSLAKEKAELYNDDRLHLSPKGYEVWQKEMEPAFAKLLA